ncbi:hypothetical protein [Antarcticibacterium arcticum]|uniref:hypothetical protein n=1 Tax=Antarcticibacterium arcticum TaxID=2585771 RepID=UPI00143D0F9A|nr:hypothetical protein [Antarcticibacterium arcticum]
MKTLNVFVENYKETTSGFNILVKIIVAFVLALIFFTVISAFVNVVQSFLEYRFY